MTVLSKLQTGFDQEDHNFLRIFKLVTVVGFQMMYLVFKWGCPDKEDSKSLETYLLKEKKMPESVFKSLFNKTMRDQIRNKSCDEFDISLMMKVIKVACKGVADKDSDVWWKEDKTKLEYLLTYLKNERNNLAHNLPKMSKRKMLKKIDELRDLLIQIVEKACDRYGIDEAIKDHTLEELEHHTDQIRDQPLSEAEILQHQKDLLFEHLKYILVDKGCEELKQKFTHITRVNPVSFIDGYNTQMKLDLVFSKIEMVEADHFGKGDYVDHKNIFKLIESYDRLATEFKANEVGTFILIEGVAGSGKTTLSKLFMCEWSKQDTDIQGLADYDLVLYLECRNYNVDSFQQLFKFLIPKTYRLIGDDIMTCSLEHRLLIIVDGLDELNGNSKKAFDEILNICKTTNHTILCTSRPEKVKDIRVPEEFYKIHLRITGISVEQRPLFVQKYHEQLVKMKRSQQSTELLVNYVQKSLILKEFFRYPLNLVLLTYLWAYGPDEVNEITTVTELYMKLHKMLKQKLLQRLKDHDTTKDCATCKLKEKIEKFLKELYRESLISLSLDEIILQLEPKERLKILCSNLSLPFREVSSAFLVFQEIHTSTEVGEQLCFPHKDVHDFFAAFGLFLAITDQSFYNSLKKIIEVSYFRKVVNSIREPLMKLFGPRDIRHIFEVLHQDGHASLEVSKFQNILKHFGGLLTIHDGGKVKEQVTKELVELFNETGITNQEQWLDIVGEMKCDDQTSKYISRSFFKNVHDITIRSPRVAGYSSIMTYINPKHVILDLEGDPDDLPHLKKLLKAISLKDCNVDLQLHHHFHHPELNKYSDDILLSLLHHDARCRVERVKGHLSGREMPPLLYLKHVAVVLSSNDQARAVTSTLRQHQIDVKEIRVLPNVLPTMLMRLPPDGEDHLDLTEVDIHNIDWACQVAEALMGKAGFHAIKLPEFDLTADVGLKLERSLGEAGVRISQYIPFSYNKKVVEMMFDTSISINDTNLEEYASSIVFADPYEVRLALQSDPDDLPQLEKLLKIISMKSCTVDLELNHHLLHPREDKFSDDLLLCLRHEHARCTVEKVTGHLSGRKIPRLFSLECVTVVLLNDDEAKAVTSSLLQRPLKYKRIRVMQGVSPDKLMSLPSGSGEVYLDLCMVGYKQNNWACQVASALMGEAGFWNIQFPGSDLSSEGCKKLIINLSQAGIKIHNLLQVCTDSFFSYDDLVILKKLTNDKLKCRFESCATDQGKIVVVGVGGIPPSQ